MSFILYNASIYTMDENHPKANALLVEDNRIVKVGSNAEIMSLKSDSTVLYDLQNKTVIPGLNDSHMHLYSFGLSLQMVDLLNLTSLQEVLDEVKKFINEKAMEENTWIRGRGWNQDYFTDDKRFLNRYDLDKISTKHPIVLSRACGHVLVCNSKALEVCGVNKNTPQIEGGQIDKDENFEPTGIFREKAVDLIYNHIPYPTLEDIKTTIINGMEYANHHGLTSIQTDDLSHIPSKDFKMMLKAFEELNAEKKLTCRINEQCLLTKEQLTEFLSLGYNTGVGDEYFKIGPLKILSDGSLGARTAAMRKPYADDPNNYGIMCFTQEELDDLIITAHKNNMQVAVHCIGDRAMDMILTSYEKAISIYPRDDHRHSIIHCQITDDEILEKYRELGIIAHVQPIFLNYDLHIVENRVGKELASTSYAFKTMLNKGIKTAYGTDCPVEPLHTMPNLYSAITRSDLNGYPQEGFNPKEKVSVSEAIYQYTMGSAYASFEEHIKGSISKGKLADLVVLSDNIDLIDSLLIKDIKVDMTFFDGELIYNRIK